MSKFLRLSVQDTALAVMQSNFLNASNFHFITKTVHQFTGHGKKKSDLIQNLTEH